MISANLMCLEFLKKSIDAYLKKLEICTRNNIKLLLNSTKSLFIGVTQNTQEFSIKYNKLLWKIVLFVLLLSVF